MRDSHRSRRAISRSAKRKANARFRRLNFETLEDRRVLALMITLPGGTISEGAGVMTATISRNTGLASPLTVNLSSSDTSEATVQASVQFAANQISRSFTITLVDEFVVDPPASVTFTATASGQTAGMAVLTVLNNDVVNLSSTLHGDVLLLNRGPQAGSHALEVGPALVTGSGSPVLATFGGQPTYQTAGTGSTVAADEFIPVDTSKTYALSGWAKSGDEFGQRYNSNNEQGFGIMSYDADRLPVLPQHVLRFAGATDTTLAMPLNPGDSTIRLTSAAGWSSGAGQPASTRALAWYGYQNSLGTTYANYTYTRNLATGGALGLWLPGAVSGNTITLAQPWAGPALPAGTAIRNATGGGDESFSLLDADTVPSDWTWNQHAGTFGGGVAQNGGNSATLFRPGTAYIKPVITANEHGAADNFISWRDVAVTRVPAGTTPAQLQLPVVDLSLPGAGDDRAPLPLSAGAPCSWAGSLVDINPAQSYTLSGKATESLGTFNVSQDEPLLQYASLDIDKKLIHPLHVTRFNYAVDTTLAAALKPGDTSFLIANASGWSNDASESAQTRALAWYGYADSTGHTYADYTYTRNVAHDFNDGLWRPGAIGYDNAPGAYRVTLNKPWSGPAIAAGAAVRNAASGPLYNALVPTANDLPGAEEIEYSASLGGSLWQNGVPSATAFRPGTAYIQPVLPELVPWTDLSIGSQGDVTALGAKYFASPQMEIPTNGQVTLDLNAVGKNFFPGAAIANVSVSAEQGTATFGAVPGGKPVIHYVSPVGFTGTDIITYTIRNVATNAQATASIAINVNDVADDVVLDRLRQIGLGMHGYENATNRFPVSGSNYFDASGQPYLSWRVHLLPFLGYQDLYDQFHLAEPWNSPHNMSLVSQMPDIYRSAGDAPNSTSTRFQTFTGPDAPFGNLPEGEDQVGPRLNQFADGLSNTLLVAEAGANRAVTWTRPDDLEFDAGNPLAALGNITAANINAVMADGSMIELLSTIDADTFKALVTIDGNEIVDAARLRREFAATHGSVYAYGKSSEDAYFRNIAIAMHNYADSLNRFPVAGSSTRFDENGRPLLSWRVHLLPYLGYRNLYDQFHLDEAWDSPHNLALLEHMPDLYRSANDASDSTTTRVMTFTGPDAPFEFRSPGSLQTGPTFADIRDGTDNTIMFVEAGADKAAPWTKPEDLPFDRNNPLAAVGDLSSGEIRGVYFSANQFTLGTDISPSVFSALVTRNGANIDQSRYDGGTIADRERARRGKLDPLSDDPNRFKEIAIALHEYVSARSRFPVDRVGTDGTPLLSWRVLILPYLGQQALYSQFRLDEPWDSPHNLSLLKYMPDVFRNSGDSTDSALTAVTTFTGPGAPFPTVPTSNNAGPRFQDITDGTSNTFMVIDSGSQIPWTKPGDTPFHTNNPFSALGPLGHEFIAPTFDAAARTYSASMSLSELAAWITNNGGGTPDNPPTIPNVPGFYIRQSAGNTVINEFGVDWFEVVLDKAPTSNVVLSLNSSAPGVAVLDKNTLAFTAANWNVPQPVALRGIDNHAINDPQSVDITVAVVDAQSNSAYQSVANQVFAALVVDDDLFPGDFDGNGTVNGGDLAVWQTAYSENASGDADGDGDSDGRDFLLWQRNVTPTLPADFDGDNDVDGQDLGIWQAAYGENSNADADDDGDSDGRDFLFWQRGVTLPAPLVEGSVSKLEPNALASGAIEILPAQAHNRVLARSAHLKNVDTIDAAILLAIDLDGPKEEKDFTVDELDYSAAVDEAVATIPSEPTSSEPRGLSAGSSNKTKTGGTSPPARAVMQITDKLFEQLL